MTAPTKLSQLNQFTIQSIESQGDRSVLTGQLTKPGQLNKPNWVSLFIQLHEYYTGFMEKSEPDVGLAVLRGPCIQSHRWNVVLVRGASFPIFDSYLIDPIDFVVDREKKWEKTCFKTLDAFEQSTPQGGKQWLIAKPGDETRTDGKFIEGLWDHVHCAFCDKHIGSGGDAEGYVSDQTDWACVHCYARYIEREDFSFVLGGTNEDDATRSPKNRASDEQAFDHSSKRTTVAEQPASPTKSKP